METQAESANSQEGSWKEVAVTEARLGSVPISNASSVPEAHHRRLTASYLHLFTT